MTCQEKRHPQRALNDPSAKTSLTEGTEWLFRCLDGDDREDDDGDDKDNTMMVTMTSVTPNLEEQFQSLVPVNFIMLKYVISWIFIITSSSSLDCDYHYIVIIMISIVIDLILQHGCKGQHSRVALLGFACSALPATLNTWWWSLWQWGMTMTTMITIKYKTR